MMNNNITNLYIHIPYCDHICSYCDFYKKKAKQEQITKYITYLEKELLLKKDLLQNINIIYVGGGTPSSIGLNNLNLFFNILKKYINLNNLIEFSIECNPKDITFDLINLFKENNINRISLGIQTLNNKKLKFLNRNHNKKDVINCLKVLKKCDFKNVNADLMYGLPNDNFNLIKKDLKIFKKYNLTHISCYSLILEEKTILYNKYLKGEFKLFDEDKEAKLYYKIQKYLNKSNYLQYELSNYCINGYECLYNLNTWDNNHYLGIGTSASYYIDNKRYTNIKNTDVYFNSLNENKLSFYEEIQLSIEDQIYEEIMLGLRKTKGINVINFNTKYNCDIYNKYPNINFLINNNFLVFDNEYLFIPKDKLYISNTIINKILD